METSVEEGDGGRADAASEERCESCSRRFISKHALRIQGGPRIGPVPRVSRPPPRYFHRRAGPRVLRILRQTIQHMKALVAGFHMLYRLSQDSKYPWPSGTTEQTRVQFLGGSNSWAALLGCSRSSKAICVSRRGHRSRCGGSDAACVHRAMCIEPWPGSGPWLTHQHWRRRRRRCSWRCCCS